MFPLSLHSEEFLSGMDAVFCQMLSPDLLRGSYDSCFFTCILASEMNVMNHIDCFMSVEPALHPRYKSYLVMENNHFFLKKFVILFYLFYFFKILFIYL